MRNALLGLAALVALASGLIMFGEGASAGHTSNHKIFVGWNVVAVHPSDGGCIQLDGNSDLSHVTLIAKWVPQAQTWLLFSRFAPDPLNTLHEVCDGEVAWIRANEPFIWRQ